MRKISRLIIVLTTSFGIPNSALAIADDETFEGQLPVEVANYSVNPHFFRDAYLRTIVTDLGINLEGDWTDNQAFRLAKLLESVNPDRIERTQSLFDWTTIRMLKIKVGDDFKYLEEIQHIPNPAAIYGRGISRDIRYTLTIKMDASDDEIKLFLNDNLPEHQIRNEKAREQWRKMAGEALGGAPRSSSVSARARQFCSTVLGGLNRYRSLRP
jgi:hypothetical protein